MDTPPPPAAPREPWVPVPRTYRWLFASLAVIGLALDLGSKYGMFHWLYHDGVTLHDNGPRRAWPSAYPDDDMLEQRPRFTGEYDLVPGWFKFIAEFNGEATGNAPRWDAGMRPKVNYGALFGLGGGHRGGANLIFAGVSLLAAIAIIAWACRRGSTADFWLSLALGLILGGTVGNMYDRFVFGGVRDFLYFYRPIPGIGDWPVFNIADCCLVLGAFVLFGQALLMPGKRPAAA